MANVWGDAWGGDTGAWLTAWGSDAATVVACASATGDSLQGFTVDSDTGGHESRLYDTLGQAVIVTAVDSVSGFCLRIRKVGSPVGTFTAEIYEASVSEGPTYSRTGSALATGLTYDASTVSGSATDYWFALSHAVTTSYIAVVLNFTGLTTNDASNNIILVTDTTGTGSGVGADGNALLNTGAVGADAQFTLYGTYETPTLSSPTDFANGATSYTGTVSTDVGAGTLYWVVTQSATSPSAAQVQAAQNHLGAAADASGDIPIVTTGNFNVSGGGLTAETTYYIHFNHLHQSLDSNVASGDGFTTSALSGDDGAIRFRGAFNRRRWGGLS